MQKNFISKDKHVSFMRSVAILVSGTTIAHGITAAALPILSRLYTPEDFSLLAVFAGLLSILAVAACLRFDVAVAIPENDKDSLNLLALAIACAGFCALVLLIFVLVSPIWLAEKLNQPKLAPYLWLLPVGVLFAGAYSALQSWFIRKKSFGIISRSRIAQSMASVGTQFGMGTLAMGPVGLLIGNVMNAGAACIGFGYQLRKSWVAGLKNSTVTWKYMKIMFIAYNRYPKYSTFEALFNSAAIQIPVIMIAAMASGPEAGYLMFAMTVMQAPMALFGTAIGQAYLSRAPGAQNEGRLQAYTLDILGALAKAGVGPLIAAGIIAPVIFGYVFGQSWERSGWLVAWMTPWFVFQFLASPVSMALHVTGNQRSALFLQLFGLFTRILAVWLIAQWWAEDITEAYALSGMVFYAIYLIVVMNTLGVSLKQWLNLFNVTVRWSLPWIVIAVIFSLVLTK